MSARGETIRHTTPTLTPLQNAIRRRVCSCGGGRKDLLLWGLFRCCVCRRRERIGRRRSKASERGKIGLACRKTASASGCFALLGRRGEGGGEEGFLPFNLISVSLVWFSVCRISGSGKLRRRRIRSVYKASLLLLLLLLSLFLSWSSSAPPVSVQRRSKHRERDTQSSSYPTSQW